MWLISSGMVGSSLIHSGPTGDKTFSDPVRHEHRTSWGVLLCLAPGCLQTILWDLWIARWGFHELDLFWHVQQMLDLVQIWGIWQPDPHFELFECFSRCGRVHCPAAVIRVCRYHVGVFLVCNSVWTGCVCQSGINMNIRPKVSQQNIWL